jgi:hypothetical protein
MKHADPTKEDAQCCIDLTKKKGKNKKNPLPKPQTRNTGAQVVETGGNRMTRIAVIYRFLQMPMRVW